MIEEIADLLSKALDATDICSSDVLIATLERALELADMMIEEEDKAPE